MSAHIIELNSYRTSIAYLKRQFEFQCPPTPEDLIRRIENMKPALDNALIHSASYTQEEHSFVYKARWNVCSLFIQAGVERKTILAMLKKTNARLSFYADAFGIDSEEYKLRKYNSHL